MTRRVSYRRYSCGSGYVMASNRREANTSITYCKPASKNDAKRYGTELVITTGNVRLILNGTQIRSLVSVLKEAKVI